MKLLNSENNTQIESDSSDIMLSDIMRIVHGNWYWFALSIFICLSIAFFYLMWTPKIYERTATVMIKDDKSSGSGSVETALFQELSIFDGKSNVNNEIIVFKSNNLMSEAIRRLKIDVSYKTHNKHRFSCKTNHPNS